MPTDAPSNLPPVLRPDNPPARSLAELATRFARDVRGDVGAVTLTGITLATADLRAGEAFVAIRGVNRHGAEFASTAAEKGAVAIVTDAAGADLAADSGLPVVVVDDPRGQLGDLSAWVYGTGADDDLPILFGTTGTNGKTSVSHLLEGILGQLGVVTGLSSTAERHIAGDIIVSRLTTPEASEFHALLALMRERGVEAVAVEVSAQALSRHRVDGLVFDVAGFTNLTHDHLDDYADMREYFEAKLPLFRADRSRRAVISLDSSPGLEVAARSEVPYVTVGTPAIAADPDAAAAADWTVEILDERPDGTTFTLTAKDGRVAHDRRPGHRPAHGGQRGPRDRHDPRGRLRVERPRRDPRRAAVSRRSSPDARSSSRATAGPPSTSTSATPPTRSRRRSRPSAASRPARSSWSSAPTEIATPPSATTWVARPSRAATS